jgi:hypothetical protein
MIVRKSPINPAILILCALFLSGCTHLLPPPQDDLPARGVLGRLVDNNVGLTDLKALGHIRLESSEGIRSGRVAMAAVVPGKLRADWLNTMGQPLISLAGDGENIHIWSSGETEVHRLRQSPRALMKLIRIPLGIEDFQSIILGRPPLPSHAAAQLKESCNDADVVSLKNRWNKEVATIRVDRHTGRLLSMQVFNGHGRLRYETQWRQWRRKGRYLLPVKITMSANVDDRLSLTVDRFWPDTGVPPSAFVLKPPPD